MVTLVATDVLGGMTKVAQQFWPTCPADNSRNMFQIVFKLSRNSLGRKFAQARYLRCIAIIKYPHNETKFDCYIGILAVILEVEVLVGVAVKDLSQILSDESLSY